MPVRANKTWIGVTVSSGTLRSEDLLSVFVDTIETIYDQNQTSPDEDLQGLLDHAAALDTESDDEADDVSDTIDELIAELDRIAPEGCVFGAHEGDGALFGFWPAVEDEDREPSESWLWRNPG